MASEERIRRVLLAGLTVLALAFGAWWWRFTAPAVDPVTGRPADDIVHSRVDLDAATGEVLPGRPAGSDPLVGVVPRAVRDGSDPDRSVVIRVNPDGAARPVRVSHVVWRETSELPADGQPVVRQVTPSPGDTYQLSVGCSGGGAVMMRLTGADSDDLERVHDCDGTFDVFFVEGAGGRVRVWFAALRGEPRLDARLEALY
ncbi:hypothetical protein [Micromonospora sp. WMMD975]|uniref:hypothetical protein n=1 Tax=Micromonospora sp. WMMD975 TaxID=3016087 RepID=UPI00249A2D20|nr:hypothetical protein [Micromonospora sp. WMMD975]WFE32492.1 hypothetical protein O7613_23375 [Micromonospora sp. WMMD975]